MVAAGARGYVLKGDAPQVVLEALEAARVGAARLSAAVTGPALTDLRGLYQAALARSEQLSAENAALSAAVARLRAEDQAREEFLSLVGHELRTPVTVLVGIAATLDAWPEVAAGPDGAELIERLVAQSRRLAGVVEQLLAAGAFAAERSPALRSDPVELGAVLAEAASAVRSRRPGLLVELALPPGCRPVTGDHGALAVAVERLADGLAARGAPGVRLTVAQPPGWTRIELAAAPAGNLAGAAAQGGTAEGGAGGGPTGGVWGAGGHEISVRLAERLVAAMGGRVVPGQPQAAAGVVIALPHVDAASTCAAASGPTGDAQLVDDAALHVADPRVVALPPAEPADVASRQRRGAVRRRNAEPHRRVGDEVAGGHATGGVGAVELGPHRGVPRGEVQAAPARGHLDAADDGRGPAGDVADRRAPPARAGPVQRQPVGPTGLPLVAKAAGPERRSFHASVAAGVVRAADRRPDREDRQLADAAVVAEVVGLEPEVANVPTLEAPLVRPEVGRGTRVVQDGQVPGKAAGSGGCGPPAPAGVGPLRFDHGHAVPTSRPDAIIAGTGAK